jgi:nitrate/nitrite-specific signal transduction histidine kinase
MKEPVSIFRKISLRRRVVSAIGLMTVLTVVIGLFGVAVVADTHQRLHKSVLEASAMAAAIDDARLAQVHFKMQVQEWKNILLRGRDKNLFDKHTKAFAEEERKVKEYLQSLSRRIAALEWSVPRIADVTAAHETLGQRYHGILREHPRRDSTTVARIDESVRGMDRGLTDEIDAIVGTIRTLAEKRLAETETVARTRMDAFYALSFFIVFLIAAGILFGIHNIRSITRELSGEGKNH